MSEERHIAIVTGGNRGIGYEVCNELAHIGCRVVLTSRNEVEGRLAVAKLDFGDKIVYHKLDVTNIREIEWLRDWIVATYGRIDILINNAGVYLDEGVSVFDVDEKIMRDTLEVNFYGAFHLCRASMVRFICVDFRSINAEEWTWQDSKCLIWIWGNERDGRKSCRI